MFKKFVERIIATDDPINDVFYGADGKGAGIDTSYQQGKITWKEHQMLLALCEKCSG